MRSIIVTSIIAGLLFNNATLHAQPLKPVMRHNLAAYTWEDEEWPNEPFGDYLNRCMKYQGNLQPFKKCKATWNIFMRHHEDDETPNHVIGNDLMTWQNLQLLCGEQEEHRTEYLAHIVDRASTEIGHITLRAWVAQPTDDVNILHQRQSYARFLLEHEALFNALNMHLEQFKESENFLLSFWLNDPLKQASDRHYFKLSSAPAIEQKLNTSIPVLTTSSILDHQKRIITVATAAFAAALLPAYGFMHLFNDTNTQFNTLAERLVGSGGPLFSLVSFIQNRYVQAAGFMGAGFYTAMHARDDYEWARDNFTISMCLQTKLHHVAQCLRAIDAIGEELDRYPDLAISGNHLSASMRELKQSNPAIQELFDLLASDTFSSTASYIANYGKILVAYRLMREHIEDLEPLLCAFGELDAYMSIARLYKEFEHARVQVTFAIYDTNRETPMIVLKDLWSPFIDPEIVIPNSIELGTADHTHNLIITGPNEGGKSTFIKATAIGLILAQSIGIVPASHAVITPFSYITTYLNITDDHGKSLFEAQVQRTKHILNHIDAMDDTSFSFAIIDELFNGTNATVGQAASYSIANYLSKKPNVISIFSTHFPGMTELEKEGNSTNYKVTATIDNDGKIHYPFKIEKGASHQNVALDIMRNEGFNEAIIEQTHEILATS